MKQSFECLDTLMILSSASAHPNPSSTMIEALYNKL